ncbi:MAG: tRNA pseudouridine(55) synthase TruB [Bacillota bacterium]
MDGILILDKPTGLSSHDCVNTARRAFSTRKVGHSGTLDPEASGVLVLAINRATKILEFLNQDDKVYRFTVRFNETTDTLDHTGEVTGQMKDHPLDGLDHAMEAFIGRYNQTPPAYSAVKVKGKKLYEYARQNQAIPTVPARPIDVYSLTRETDPVYRDGMFDVTFKVHASKGLYVRKLAQDLADALGTLAHTTMIRRLKAGPFSIEKSTPFDDLKAKKPRLISMNQALSFMPEVILDEETAKRVGHGRKIELDRTEPLLRLVRDDRLVAIYEKEAGVLYRAKKVLETGGTP